MNSKRTDLIVILDKSGSMSGTANDVIGGFNQLVKDQKATGQQIYLTLVQFDDYHEMIYNAVSIDKVSDLTKETYRPGGNTALLDAIGRTINEMGTKYASMSESSRPAKIVVTIMTDGQENASKEFTRTKIFEMIKHQTDKYNWQFVFIGANQDSITEASSLGISAANAINYNSTAKGTRTMMKCVSSNISRYSAQEGSTIMSFSDQDKEIIQNTK